jgi:hypothetical protein
MDSAAHRSPQHAMPINALAREAQQTERAWITIARHCTGIRLEGSAVKLRSTSIEDAYQELDYVLRGDGGRCARAILHVVTGLYRAHRAILCCVLKRRWRPAPAPTVECPVIGPFELTESELENGWERQ